MKKFYIFLSTLIASSIMGLAQEAAYELPTPLRYLATISNAKHKPVCNLTTQNPINDGAYLWAPVGSTVTYIDASTGAPQSWLWETTGGNVGNGSSQDARITYPTTGTFTLPKLTVGFESGQQTVASDLKLKVGGVAELCLADCREWLTTYALGVNTYDQANGAERGSLGGTNTLDITGVGNLYMTAIEDGFLDGANIYLPSKPTKWKEGAKIGVRVWMANITETNLLLTAIPIEGGEIKFEDIKTADDGVWVPVKNGAVIQFRCTEPIDLYGKPLLFIDVYGWSNDPATEDFKMLMDVMPNQEMAPENASNMLAHNSFVRLKDENEYMRPVSYFGGNYGSFMICPLVRGGETPFGSIRELATDIVSPLHVTVGLDEIILSGADAPVEIINLTGYVCLKGNITDGSAAFSTMALQKGVYVARSATGQTIKFIVK